MAKTGKSVEGTFNQALGAALVATTARWRAKSSIVQVEQTQTLAGAGNRAKRPDILIVDALSPPVIIETSFGKADADKDAKVRLGARTADRGLQVDTTLALYIDPKYRTLALPEIKEALVSGKKMQYALHQRIDNEEFRRWPTKGFIRGTVHDIARLLSAAALPRESVEQVASDIAERVNQSADLLETALSPKQLQQVAALVQQRTPLKGLRTTMVLWLNALLTQQRLSMQGVEEIPPLDFSASPLPVPSKQVEVWQAVLGENWRSIFDPAIRVLSKLGNIHPSATGQALKQLIRAVEKIELARLGLYINVGAELFPKLSEDRKRAAAFYTQPATAELLAALTIRADSLRRNQWRSGRLFERCRLADLACGTGTLLRAGYRRISELHEQAGGTEETVRQLHRTAMESGLIGTDVSPIAAHLTSSSLAALGSGEPYGDTQIGWVAVGGVGLTGALEYFHTDEVRDLFEDVAGRATGGGSGALSVVIGAESVDWILMNPPYSRTRGGQSAFDIAGLTESERKACQKRWGRLVKNEPVNNKAGMAASFLALARRKVRRNGRIGFVLPLTAAFADSWAVTRQMIEREFTDITAIAVAAGQALGQEALSADTDMEEMLLVATRRSLKDEGNAAPIHCVTLHSPPIRIGEAGEIARAIGAALKGIGGAGTSRPIRVGEDELGQVAVFDAGGNGAPWSPLGVKHAGLAFAADGLTTGKLTHLGDALIPLGVDMSTIGDVFEVGPTHHLIGHLHGGDEIGAFEFHPVISSTDAIGKDRALWEANGEKQRRLVVLPTHKGSAPANVGSDRDRQAMRACQSTLFYARNMRWTSQALLAATTRRSALGGRAWTTLGHEDARVLKAFALWANSTFGMVMHWTKGQRTHAGRSTTQIGALKRVPCPRLDCLDDPALDQGIADFDKLSKTDLLPACQAHVDPTRIAIDEAVVRLLGLPCSTTKTLEDLRRLWCSEPSVHGSNQAALRRM